MIEKQKLFFKPKKNDILVETFVEVCSNTTAHALPNIFRSKNPVVKFFWFILFLFGSGFSIYYVYSSFNTFFSYPVSVDVKTYEFNLDDFPAVTICNINPFDTSNPLIMSFLDSLLNESGIKPEIKEGDQTPFISQIRTAMKVLKANAMMKYLMNSSFSKSIGYSLNSMLISCYFNGEQCTSDDFSQFFSFEYGICHTFNKKNDSNKLKMTSRSGPNSGLSLEIFTGYPEKQDFYIEKRGLYVAVHNNSQNPLTKYDGIKIPVGYATDVAIKRTFYERLPSPYGDCLSESDYLTKSDYSEFITQFFKYSRKLCFDVCLQHSFIYQGCNCTDPSIPSMSPSYKICSSFEELNCVNNVIKNFDSTDLSAHCNDKCPSECSKVLYETIQSQSDYPTRYYYNQLSKHPSITKILKNLNQNLTYETCKESFLMVNIFYPELLYTNITESAGYDFTSLIGTIGGQTGLFLGCSLLTFFEPIEFLIDVLYKLFKRKNSIVSN